VRQVEPTDVATRPRGGGRRGDVATLRALRLACQGADGDALRRLFVTDVVAVVDGGGIVRAPPDPVTGAAAVVDYLLELLGEHPRRSVSEHSVNGRTGIVLRSEGRVIGIVGVGTRLDLVDELLIVLNPEKLRAWNLA
jgi:RNA polymerase sigma-70 factor, ECF subfamily